jgi:hypothetical protein
MEFSYVYVTGPSVGFLISYSVSCYIAYRIHEGKRPIFVQMFIANFFIVANCIANVAMTCRGEQKPYLPLLVALGVTSYAHVLIERLFSFIQGVYLKNGLRAVSYILGTVFAISPFFPRFVTAASASFYLFMYILNYSINGYIAMKAYKSTKAMGMKGAGRYFTTLFVLICLSISMIFATSFMASQITSQNFYILNQVGSLISPLQFVFEVIFQFSIQRIFETRKVTASKVTTDVKSMGLNSPSKPK